MKELKWQDCKYGIEMVQLGALNVTVSYVSADIGYRYYFGNSRSVKEYPDLETAKLHALKAVAKCLIIWSTRLGNPPN